MLYDAAADRVLWARTLAPDVLAELAAAATETLPGCGLAVERVGRRVDDGRRSSPSPDYRHAWADGDDDRRRTAPELLARPAVKLLVRSPRLSQRRDGRRAHPGDR